MKVVTEFKIPVGISKPGQKKMISIDGDTVSVNFSSLDMIQTCLRKAMYVLNEGLIKDAPALNFGTAIHKAMESYYECQDDRLERALDSFKSEWEGCGIPDDDKRSYKNGVAILRAYAETYKDDPWVVYQDGKGKFIERDLEFPFATWEGVKFNYHGRIDMALLNTNTGEIAITDHKTTSSLGNDFIKRAMMSTQFMGYLAGARAVGVPSNVFMTNGIGVFKGPKKFLRLFNEYNADRMVDFYDWAMHNTIRWLLANKTGAFPISAPGPCSQWGGCQFIEACSAPVAQREFILKGLYEKSQETTGISDVSDF